MEALLETLRGLLATYDPELEKPSSLRFRRNLLFLMLGVIATTLVVFGLMAVSRAVVLNATNVLFLDAVLTPVIVLTAATLRRRWTSDRHSRRLVGFILLMTAIYVGQDLTGWYIGRSLYHTTLGNAVSFSILCVFMAPLTSGALFRSAAWAGFWTSMMVLDRSHFYIYFHVGNVGAATIATIWLPQRVIDRWIQAAARERGSTDSRSNPDDDRSIPRRRAALAPRSSLAAADGRRDCPASSGLTGRRYNGDRYITGGGQIGRYTRGPQSHSEP